MQGLCWGGLRCRECARDAFGDQGIRGDVNRRFNICSFPATVMPNPLRSRQLMAHILLVEDDADVQSIVSEFLAAVGHRVISASSAEQARLVLTSEPVDIALIDCLMSGERGNSLAEHTSRLGIPTILTSGDPHYIETRSGDSFPFLPKPFRLTSLDELIVRTLCGSGTT